MTGGPNNGGIIGVSDHGGWAVLVTVARDGTPLDRRRVELVDEGLPKLPYHHDAQRLPPDEAVALVERVRVSAERHARLALEAVTMAVPRILGVALRNCPELPPTIAERINDYRSQNAADWVMYRKALSSAAEARGWPVHWYDARKILEEASQTTRVDSLEAHFLHVRRSIGPPWNKDHKLAMAAAIVAAKALAILLLVLLGAAAAADAQVQPQLAERYFKEATTLCERDAGRLWGVSLCGPMVIVDQATGTRATSQPEPDAPPPRFSSFADGPVSWGGLRWFSFPLSMLPEKDADVRQQVMLHGLFHRIQPELGLMTEDGFNEHLDTLEGRVWMQLEWRALRRAIESTGSDRAEAIADALAFRRERRARFPGAADNERREEIREGLASYTGIAVWANSPADAHRAAAAALAAGESQPAFVGNFEAQSGPAYGVLLDDLLPGWRRQVRGTSDLGDLLASATNKPPTTDVAVAAARYHGATLRTAEEARDRAQQVRVAELRRRFVDGPVLTMPAVGSGTSDTTGSVGIPGAGTVLFHNFTQSGQWGRLDANGGVLRAADGLTLSVPATGPLEGTTLRGDGWAVTVNAGWIVRPAARPGSFTIVRER